MFLSLHKVLLNSAALRNETQRSEQNIFFSIISFVELFFLMFIFERVHARRQGRGIERETEVPKQAPH